jgi:uncharacterized protein (DUF305 family)
MSPSHREALAGRPAAAVATSQRGAHESQHSSGGLPLATEMHGHMRAMMAAMDSVQMTGDPDRDFLLIMIPHHQGAVDMAHSVLVHGRDPITRQIAEEIIAGQTTEIAGMNGRLRTLASSPGGHGEYPALGGTRGAPGPDQP